MCYVPLEEVDAKSFGKEAVFFKDYRTNIYNQVSGEYQLYTDFGYVGYFDLQPELSRVRFVKCKDCVKIFGLGEGQQRRFEDKGFTLPKRCKACRQRNV